MTFLLSDQKGTLLLRATMENSWCDYFPVSYEGDTSLLERAPKVSDGAFMTCTFQRAAKRHNLVLGGDFEDHRLYL